MKATDNFSFSLDQGIQSPEKGFHNRRHQRARLAQAAFRLTTLLAVIFLATLLITVLNKSMGYVVLENKVDPFSLSDRPISDLNNTELAQILRENLRKNRVRTLERAGFLEDQPRSTLVQLVNTEIIQPEVVESYNLFPSLINRSKIMADAAVSYPTARVEFRFWLNGAFLTNSMASQPELAGVRSALLGSLQLILITILTAFPIGVGAAIYL
jgi:phosphate transport system permease protein